MKRSFSTQDVPSQQLNSLEKLKNLFKELNLQHQPTETAIEKSRVKLDSLKYFDYYPKKVQNWIVDAKHPKGYYDIAGDWKAGYSFETFFQNKEDAEKKKTLEKNKEIEEDLKGHYRFGVKEEEIAPYPEKLKKLLSFENASQMEKNQFRIEREIQRWGRFEGDTGSPEVQIAILTVKIKYMNQHVQHHPKDHHSRFGLQKMAQQRRRMLRYLKRDNPPRYYKVIKELELPDEQFTTNLKKTVFK